MEKVPIVRDIMVEASFSVHVDTPAYEAADALIAKKLAGVPVVDDAGALVGFLTEKDCLRLQVTSHQYNMTGRTVRDIMSDIKGGLSPDADILTAGMRFMTCHFATLPVLENGSLIGSLSRQNMLAAIQAMHRKKGLAIQSDKTAQRIQDNPSSIDQIQILVGKSSKKQLASVFGGRLS